MRYKSGVSKIEWTSAFRKLLLFLSLVRTIISILITILLTVKFFELTVLTISELRWITCTLVSETLGMKQCVGDPEYPY